MDGIRRFSLQIPVGKLFLTGDVCIPTDAKGFVIFSHGSGSSRLSPRNKFVAGILNQHQTGTLLVDLLSEEEDVIYDNRFDIDLLTDRLISVTNYIKQYPDFAEFPIACFGASTGAASALRAAAILQSEIKVVVSRGGRPDLAMDKIQEVKSPTLLIVGELDTDVILLNRHAYAMMKCVKKMEIVEGATHLFEEPGTLEKVAELAAKWFDKYLIEKKHNQPCL